MDLGISGIFLLTNLILAILVAWPKRRAWRGAPKPVRTGPKRARLYSWHRAVGLWAVLPAIALIATGTMLRFEDNVAEAVGYDAPDVEPIEVRGREVVSFAEAASNAQAAIPGSELVSASLPDDEDAIYRFRLLEPGELRRAYGTSLVFVNGLDGPVLAALPASEASWRRSFMNSLYAIHTGESAGLMGRILNLLLGI